MFSRAVEAHGGCGGQLGPLDGVIWYAIPGRKRPDGVASLHVAPVVDNLSLYLLHGRCEEARLLSCSLGSGTSAPALVVPASTLQLEPLYLVSVAHSDGVNSSAPRRSALQISYRHGLAQDGTATTWTDDASLDASLPPGVRFWRGAPPPAALSSPAQLAVGAALVALVLAGVGERRRPVAALCGTAVWIASRTCAAAGMLWVPVPLIGFLRADLAAPLLAAYALVGAMVARLLPEGRRLALVAALVTALAVGARAAMPRRELRAVLPPEDVYRTERAASAWRRLGVANATVTKVSRAMTADECEAIGVRVLASHAEWTLASVRQFPMPYFSLGPSSNHAGGVEEPSPWWSLAHGLRSLEGNLGDLVLGRRGRAHRERSQSVLRRAAWLQDPLRAALAAHLGVARSHIVFGGEGEIGHLWHPAVQVYLPSVLWGLVLNPHSDNDVFAQLLSHVGGGQCDDASRRAFLLPLATPPGAGLLYWNLLRPDGTPSELPVEHAVQYEVGALYSWSTDLVHALQPWPYAEWDAAALRITLQLFGVQCGEKWYFYH